MTDWTVTVTVPDVDHVHPELMEKWEQELDDFDASAARPRDGEVDLHLYLSADDPLEASGIAFNTVLKRLGLTPVGIETLTEIEYERRANAPTLPELVSASEIGDILGVARQRVHQLRSTAAFPLPLAELRGGAVWDAAAVRKFAREWTRKPGRPTRMALLRK